MSGAEPSRTPWQALLAFAGLSACGGVLLWLALSGLLPPARDLVSGAPLISLAARDASGLPLAVSFFALAAMTLFPMPVIGAKRRRPSAVERRRRDGAALCLGIAVVAAISTVMAAPVTQLVAQSVAAWRGYRPCAPLPGERPTHLRWIRPDADPSLARCPAPP